MTAMADRLASVLTSVISAELRIEDVIGWIKSDNVSDEKLASFDDDVRRGFVPYFLNYLREETGQTLQSCGHVAAASSATPLSKPPPTSVDARQKRGAAAISQSSSTRGRLFGDGPARATRDATERISDNNNANNGRLLGPFRPCSSRG